MYGANVPSRFIGETSVLPACTRDVPSAMALPPSSTAPRSHSDRNLQARLALAAGRDEREDHVVALGKAGDVLADLGDHARTLVAAERGKGDRGGTGGQVVVGVAHARRVHADLDLIGDGIAHVDLVDPERRVELPQQSALGLPDLRS
jgi:hypothetical protein